MQIEISLLDLVKTCLFVLWFFKIWANLIIFEFFIVFTKMPAFCVFLLNTKNTVVQKWQHNTEILFAAFLIHTQNFSWWNIRSCLVFSDFPDSFCCFNRAEKMPQTICYWKDERERFWMHKQPFSFYFLAVLFIFAVA